MKDCNAEDSIERFFKDSRTIQRFRSGPLGPYIQQLTDELSRQGYARGATRLRVRIAHQFGLWLTKRHVQITDLTTSHANQYLARYANIKQGDAKTLRMLLDILVGEGIVRRPPEPAKTEAEKSVDGFSIYLEQQLALAPRTIEGLSRHIRFFLAYRFGDMVVDLRAVQPEDVIAFVRRDAARKCAASAKNTTTALRSFLRYLQYSGFHNRDLASAVPSVADWSLSNIPRGLSRHQVRCVLCSCNRKTSIGRRDYAVLLLLVRLGLRAGEVAALTLDDIDWAMGSISVCSKGGTLCRLPLPRDVGDAIATYLRKDRPTVSSRRVFLRIPAPHTGFEGHRAVCLIVKYALARAGVQSRSRGAHQFRHTLASEMLKHGAALVDIGHILRHKKPKTTFIYAKVDFAALRPLAKRWPGGIA